MSKGRPRHELSRFFTILEERVNKKDPYCYCNMCFNDALKTMEKEEAEKNLKFRYHKDNCSNHLKKCKFYIHVEANEEQKDSDTEVLTSTVLDTVPGNQNTSAPRPIQLSTKRKATTPFYLNNVIQLQLTKNLLNNI